MIMKVIPPAYDKVGGLLFITFECHDHRLVIASWSHMSGVVLSHMRGVVFSLTKLHKWGILCKNINEIGRLK